MMGHEARRRCAGLGRVLAVAFAALAPAIAYSQSKTLTQRLAPVRVIYSSFTASHVHVWLAADRRLYEKYGLDVQLIHGRGTAPVQALVSGSADIGVFAGPIIVNANLGGSDLVAVAAKPGFLVSSIWTRADSKLKTIHDLQGKTLAVSNPGGATYLAARLALRKFGVAETAVKFLYHSTLRESFAALEKGWVDAAVGSAPPGPGFQTILDLAKERIPFLLSAVAVRRDFLRAHRPLVVDFLKAHVESINLAKQSPDLAAGSIAKQLKVSPEVALAAHGAYVPVWQDIPYVQAESIQSIVDLLSKEAKENLRVERLIDNSILKELDDSGFIKQLSRR